MVNYGAGEYLQKNTSNLGYFLVHHKWDMLQSISQPVEWLILGDSSGNQGLDPRIISQRMGGNALNSCSIGDLILLNDAWMLQTYIQKYGAPSHVIHVHVYDIFCREINPAVIGQVPLQFEFWKHLKPEIQMKPHEKLQYLLSRYFPLFSQEKSLSKALNPLYSDRKIQLHPDGFLTVFDSDPLLVSNDIMMHKAFLEAHDFSISPPNQQSLQVMAELAQTYQFSIHICASPIASTLAENSDFITYFKSEYDYLDSFSRQYQNIHVLFQNPISFPDFRMESADHLVSADDVRQYSMSVCDAIDVSTSRMDDRSIVDSKEKHQ